MLPRNPFNIAYAEMVDSSETFLALFDHTAISGNTADNRPFISEEMFEQTVFFSSSPGGGKSSMFHFFSPDILNSVLQNRNQNIDSFEYLQRLGVLTASEVHLLGVQVSCARNYEIIEDIYDTGIDIQLFFALLNVRILKETLKSILSLKKSDASGLQKITICNVPTELNAYFSTYWTGKEYYDWACEEERRLCASINNMEETQQIGFIHHYLSVIQLFEPDKIYFDGKPVANKVLFMLDDVHKLTQRQREALQNSLFTVRARVGVWLAQRSFALDENELLGQDGNIGRDYVTRKLEDQRDGQHAKTFYKTLEAIADRRVKANALIDISNYRSCVEDNIDWYSDKDNSKKLVAAYEKLYEELKPFLPEDDLKSITEEAGDLFEKAIVLRSIKIFVDRQINNQQIAICDCFLGPLDTDLEKIRNGNSLRPIAEYYLCIESGLPFYYGMGKLFQLSFNNVYQFLRYCGEIFERRLAYKYEARRRRANTVPPVDQEKIITRVSKQYWDEIDVIYSRAKSIKTLISNIAHIGAVTRDVGAASYSGGTFTGIGIREHLYKKILFDKEYQNIKSILATCVSGNLLKIKQVKQGGKNEMAVVFYLNRWMCVYFKLPLAYGGWKLCNSILLKHVCEDQTDLFKSFYGTGEGFLDEY